jgi:hypothetical protein
MLRYDTDPWGAYAILAAKPHHEQVHFKYYIWRMTINYRKLNQVTEQFCHLIHLCDDAVQDLGDAWYLLSMDMDSDFHQVYVSAGSQSKLVFYGPAGRTYCYTGMPFGPVNTPPRVYMHDGIYLSRMDHHVKFTSSRPVVMILRGHTRGCTPQCVFFPDGFFLLPVLDKVLNHMPCSDDLQDCFTVEIVEDTKWDSILKPSLASVLPSHSEWKAASASDHDVSLCIDCTKDATRDIVKQPWFGNWYRTLLKDQALEQEDSILFYTSVSQKQALLRTTRVFVVPLKLHPVLFAAYHTSAGNGHASFKASFWKFRLRFYWSNMHVDVRRACYQRAQCALANATQHTVEYTKLPCDRPFGVLFSDVWSPGATPSRNGDCKGLNVMEGMSGFIV